MDKAEERCSNKNLLTNPKNPNICVFLSLGICITLNSKALANKDFLFISIRKTRKCCKTI